MSVLRFTPETPTTRFILASGSPRRREMIASLGIQFEIIKPDIDETQHIGEDPYTYVERLSRQKAQAVLRRLSEKRSTETEQAVSGQGAVVLAADTIVLAADTIGVETDGGLLGKPVDADDAWAMLRRLRGTWHIVCTAFCLMQVDQQYAAAAKRGTDRLREPEGDAKLGVRNLTVSHRVSTRVLMRDYADAEIEAYVGSGDPFDKAGGYAIQHAGFRPVAQIDGCYNNVVGLPLCAVKRALVVVRWPGIVASDGCDCPVRGTE